MHSEQDAEATGTDRDASTRNAARSIDLLVVGPAGHETAGTGGIGQYIAEQRRHLADHLDVEVVDTAVRTPERRVEYLRAALTVLVGWVAFLGHRRPDLVHVHTSHSLSFYVSTPYVLVAALLWRRPVVVHVHGSSFDSFVAEASIPVAALQRLVFGVSDAVIALSEYWRTVLARRVSDDRIAVVPNAVDPEPYDPDPGGDPPHLVFVANHVERKGVVETTRAIDRLHASDVAFRATIAGDGPLAVHARAAARAHDEVEYVGYVSERRKRRLLSRASVYVLPTYAEGLPISILEAMAGGNAVVATDVGAIASVVDADNGALVTPGDVDELTGALAALLADPSRIEGMGGVSRSRIADGYAWDDVTTQLLGLYDRVLDGEQPAVDPPVATAAG